MTPFESLAAHCSELNLADLRKPGVYILFSAGKIIYIGESNNVLCRVGQHAGALNFDRVLYFAEVDKRERRAIESALTRRFDPSCSSVFSRRDEARDVETLERSGPSYDPHCAQPANERAAASRTPQARLPGARVNCFFNARRKALESGKSELAATRAANRARREFDARHGLVGAA